MNRARANLVRPIHNLDNVPTRYGVLKGGRRTDAGTLPSQQPVLARSAYLVPVQCCSIARILLLNTVALHKALLEQTEHTQHSLSIRASSKMSHQGALPGPPPHTPPLLTKPSPHLPMLCEHFKLFLLQSYYHTDSLRAGGRMG